MEETNLQSTDPDQKKDTGGEENVSGETSTKPLVGNPTESPLTIEGLSAITGRKYDSAEDAVKHIQNLNSLVGEKSIADARKKAEQFDQLSPKYQALVEAYAETNQMTLEQAQVAIEDYIGKKTTGFSNEMVNRFEKLETRYAKDDFLTEHPEAKEVIDLVEVLAKDKGVSLKEAYLDSPLVKMVTKSDGGETTEPNKRIGISSQELGILKDKLASGKGTVEDKQALVRALRLAE